MPDVRFYHMTRTTMDQALPALLAKSLERGWRAVVMIGSTERMEALDHHLWTYDDRSFLPHGSSAEGYAAYQPVWLTVEDENPNRAQVLFLTDGAVSGNLGLFETVCVLFDGNDDAAVQKARGQWTGYKEQGLGLTYWQQADGGGWRMKQEVPASA